jgi:hypothetical protein
MPEFVSKCVEKYDVETYLKSHTLNYKEDYVGLSVCKEHISATRWRFYTLTAVALQKRRQQQRAWMIYSENVQL